MRRNFRPLPETPGRCAAAPPSLVKRTHPLTERKSNFQHSQSLLLPISPPPSTSTFPSSLHLQPPLPEEVTLHLQPPLPEEVDRKSPSLYHFRRKSASTSLHPTSGGSQPPHRKSPWQPTPDHLHPCGPEVLVTRTCREHPVIIPSIAQLVLPPSWSFKIETPLWS